MPGAQRFQPRTIDPCRSIFPTEQLPSMDAAGDQQAVDARC